MRGNSVDDAVIDRIEADLMKQHGALIGAADLARLLGYRTTNALHQAKRRGQLGIQMHSIAHRRGHFALATDVAHWLAALRGSQTVKAISTDRPE
jgi:prophage antirepressor-like protein